MRHIRRTSGSPPTSSQPHHRRHILKKTNKIYAIGKCQTYLLLISLLFNFMLIYWTTQIFTRSPSVPDCSIINNEPYHPCNPDYLSKLIQSNPKLQANLHVNKIIPRSLHSESESNAIQINDPSNENSDTSSNANQPNYGNKIQFKQDLKIKTASNALSSSQMSSIADVNKRELSWMSPLSRSASNQRANPNLYITNSEHDIWFNNRFFVFEEEKVAFCVMEKNSCSMFKQIFKRVRGKKDYLSTDYTKIHYLPYRGLEDISFHGIDALSRFLNDDDFYFATFVREPLERLVSGYIDKCDKKRGVNLCDYARWSPRFEEEHGQWGNRRGSFTPSFGMWADGLFHCPCWPETDWHFAPQFNFCNLYQYVDRFDVFRFENRTHRKLWMQRAGFWDAYGKSGWKTAHSNDGVSIVDFGPQQHSSTGKYKGGSKYIDMYKNIDPDILASIIDHYRNDYIIFGIQMADWMCDEVIPINNNVKRALRTLPRTSRPPCDKYKWLWERE